MSSRAENPHSGWWCTSTATSASAAQVPPTVPALLLAHTNVKNVKTTSLLAGLLKPEAHCLAAQDLALVPLIVRATKTPLLVAHQDLAAVKTSARRVGADGLLQWDADGWTRLEARGSRVIK